MKDYDPIDEAILAAWDDVDLTFCKTDREFWGERVGRNPQTGEAIYIAPPSLSEKITAIYDLHKWIDRFVQKIEEDLEVALLSKEPEVREMAEVIAKLRKQDED